MAKHHGRRDYAASVRMARRMTSIPPNDETMPADSQAWRAAAGMTIEQAARRSGLTEEALRRFEAGDGGLTGDQRAALARALAPPTPPPAPRPLLDLGLIGAVLMLLGAAIPAAMAVATGIEAFRFIGAEEAVAEVVGFERRTRMVEPEHGDRYSIETLAPLFRFRGPEGREVTIAWHDTQPHEAAFAEGQRVRLVYPRGAPQDARLSVIEVALTPLVCLMMAAPLLIIGLVSWRHWCRRRVRPTA
jgi:transcriptional regulator with XRE-family HTH domain